MNVEFKKLYQGVLDPKYGTDGSAGMDLFVYLPNGDYSLKSKEYHIFDTGICVKIPEGFNGEIRSRSGIAAKYGLFILNSPGTIDSDYTGEIKLIVANFGDKPFIVENGMRLGQLVLMKYEKINLINVKKLIKTKRGNNGLGSTGI